MQKAGRKTSTFPNEIQTKKFRICRYNLRHDKCRQWKLYGQNTHARSELGPAKISSPRVPFDNGTSKRTTDRFTPTIMPRHRFQPVRNRVRKRVSHKLRCKVSRDV